MIAGQARRIRRIDFTAADLDRTRRFYEALGFQALGTEPLSRAELRTLDRSASTAERLAMRLGRQEVGFTRFDPPGRPYPAGSTSTDIWFQHIAIAVSDMREAYRLTVEAGAAPITVDGPQTLPANTGGVTAYKFRDPDGHPLELLCFPPGVGAAVWHGAAGAAPCLGIDHTAISVSDLDASRVFYENLGLRTGQASHNRGIGQRHLDDIIGDRVDVVPLQLPDEPPHVELLGYQVGSRRPMPPDTRADDIWATRIWIDVETTDGFSATAGLVTPGLIGDPDGHAIVIVGPS